MTNWKPRRSGNIYCSTACGRGCKWSEYQRARREAEAMAKALGKGFKAYIWENLGWFGDALSPDGRLRVSALRQNFRTGPIETYEADLMVGGDKFLAHGRNPKSAVLEVLKRAEHTFSIKIAELAKAKKLIEAIKR